MAADKTGGSEVTLPAKSKRVRTGCLTCRERHLKCDEEVPDCRNCRKSNRECKRGVRLNFIDITCEAPPHIPAADEWSVEFHDESRLIASEYRGGLGLYAKLDAPIATPTQEGYPEAAIPSKPQLTPSLKEEPVLSPIRMIRQPSRDIPYDEPGQINPDLLLDAQIYSRKTSGTSYAPSKGLPSVSEYGGSKPDALPPIKELISRAAFQQQGYRSGNAPSRGSLADITIAGSPLSSRDSRAQTMTPDYSIKTPPHDKPIERERSYLEKAEELEYMQVFVEEVGIWMDSLDKQQHFSRLVPFYALKCPMLLNAILACGVRHLALTRKYGDEKALNYYDTATRLLLHSLQNPDRNTGECAATAVVLNVYEIMSEKPAQRMKHIAGARALIRECKWDAKSTGLGNACFWLNVGMELLSCLAYNWQTAWDPELWGVNMDFNTEREPGNEEIWVQRMFFITAKISNFRASVPKFQEASPHDEQLRVQYRINQWDQLKGMCKDWDDACPRSMHPYGYVHPSQQPGMGRSLFPNVWLIKRAAVIGRLYYHMALCILAQVNPTGLRDSEESLTTQQHHAHQVCGIVAHTKDHGVASVSIRSIAIVAEVLTERAEQEEVVYILERIERETGWRLIPVIRALRKVWGWEDTDSVMSEKSTTPSTVASEPSRRAIDRLGSANSLSSIMGPVTTPQSLMAMGISRSPGASIPPQMQPLPAPIPMRAGIGINPLSFADFSLPNHPYQDDYKPPRSNAYNSQDHFWS